MSDLISSLYPPPPPYLQFFTAENVKRAEEIRQSHGADAETVLADTKDLKFLVPPLPPNKPQYRSFGDIWNFEDKFITLEESGIQQLYDEAKGVEEETFTQDRIEELKKMTKSLLLNFLEFTGLLAKNPTVAQTKIEHIRIILINLHHLLNSYRLHQSREGLILKIEEKIRNDTETIEKIEKTCKQVEQTIQSLVWKDTQSNMDEIEIDRPEKPPTRKQLVEKMKQSIQDS
ncbi:hypothetical protein OGAPHI_002775 [Ogataea philodendri]|uniref:Mediator of RNA polymerase II transcription subunit 7 n=1 Tax=Ogataea philodendri TaxID=1378263 RepID=A0A9P8T5U1_9ASCO|nr:uncharacterized protein OGAPHI_002775 [Ogataea philodendri]KAH3667126.1 hypothetical protein OGAPHI_002775 [Ogataea philodendri]